MGEDPISTNSETDSSVTESSSSLTELSSGSSSVTDNSSAGEQRSSENESSQSSESSSYEINDTSSETNSSNQEESSTPDTISSNSSSQNESSSSEEVSEAQTPEKEIIEGSWKFADYIGGGPQERTIDLNVDKSATYSIKILGAERNTAEGTWEINGDSILLNWDNCTSSGEDTECDGVDATGIPIEFEWDGTTLYSLDNKIHKYVKQ